MINCGSGSGKDALSRGGRGTDTFPVEREDHTFGSLFGHLHQIFDACFFLCLRRPTRSGSSVDSELLCNATAKHFGASDWLHPDAHCRRTNVCSLYPGIRRPCIAMPSMKLLVAGATASLSVGLAVRHMLKKWAKDQHRRVLVAVSGTIQDGFELRKNIDFKAPGEPTIEAVLVGTAVMRGVKMFFDIKDAGCREYDANTPHRVNPAMVLTGRWEDANQYALYLVDERACLNALLGEPRLLTMVPDAIRIDLDDKDTSPEVAALARAFIARDGKSNASRCAVLSVVRAKSAGRACATDGGAPRRHQAYVLPRVARRLRGHRRGRAWVCRVERRRGHGARCTT